MKLPVVSGGTRILDLDLENRPLSYWYDDRPTAQITAIATCWVGDPRSMEVHLLGRDEYLDMLSAFVLRYDEANVVTGHFLTRHDLPIINGALIEAGLKPLSPKLAIDTKTDYIKRGDIPATQEFVSDMLGIKNRKHHVSQSEWRESNKLTPEGIETTRKRVVSDVLGHMELRLAMTRAGLLRTPKVWRP